MTFDAETMIELNVLLEAEHYWRGMARTARSFGCHDLARGHDNTADACRLAHDRKAAIAFPVPPVARGAVA